MKPVNLLCPLPLDQEDQAFLPRLHAALVEDLYRQSWAALITMCLISVFMRIIVDEAVSRSPILHWIFVAMWVIIAGRLIWLFSMTRFPDRFPSTEARHLGFIVGATLTSACFVAINTLAFPNLGPFPLALLCICEASSTAAAMVTMGGSPLAYALYMLPITGSMMVMTIVNPPPTLARIFLSVIIIYAGAQLAVSLTVHRTLHGNILSRLKLGDLALGDALTGLRNRRYLHEFLEVEIPRLLRSWHPNDVARGTSTKNLAFIMLDLDRFKSVNDTYGHAAGDEVLKQVAQVLKEITRKPDLIARWGGEEFVVLVLDAPRTLPMIAAERIREAIENHPFRLPSGEILRKTCSLGYAHFPFLPELPDRLSWEQVLNLADGALYQAKQSGRNRTIGVVPGGAAPHLIAEALQNVEEGLEHALAGDLLRLS